MFCWLRRFGLIINKNYERKEAFLLSPIESNSERYCRDGAEGGVCIIEPKICKTDAKSMSNSAMIGAYFHKNDVKNMCKEWC